MMDILMSETCWAHNKWNKIASDIKRIHTSDIKLVFHPSNIAMTHGPINIRTGSRNFLINMCDTISVRVVRYSRMSLWNIRQVCTWSCSTPQIPLLTSIVLTICTLCHTYSAKAGWQWSKKTQNMLFASWNSAPSCTHSSSSTLFTLLYDWLACIVSVLWRNKVP